MNSTLSRLALGGLLTAFAACAHVPVQSDALSLDPAAGPKTQVFVLGMIHSGHRTSETWGLDTLRETIRAIDPDVICTEIPPANWPSTLATWKADHVVEDSRVRVFPEYTDVLLPLTDELDFVVAPSAGWTAEMATSRRERIQAFETQPEFATAFAAYTEDEVWVAAWRATHPAPAAADDPFYIHSPAYDLVTKAQLGPYEFHLNDVIGAPGGWRHINEAHFARIEAAIQKHPGERVLVTFGAGHKYWFLEQLRAMPEVELVDVRPYLGATPGSLGRTSEATRAADEVLVGLDHLRVWWARSRGDSARAWTRVAGMLDLADQGVLRTRLNWSGGSQASEFRNGPFLGPVELVAADGAGRHFRVEVRRLHDEPSDAQWLTVTLVPDDARPGGFAWRALSLPDWLLTPESSDS